MRKTSISVTEAARHFADCVNRAHYQDTTFVLLKNGSAVAQLAPNHEKTCTGRYLAAVLAKTKLSDEEARAWKHDLHSDRQTLKAPGDKWQ
jgi:antitoxin (DNA-binding transcriptional repressor) of toxin-antitoxin stability system